MGREVPGGARGELVDAVSVHVGEGGDLEAQVGVACELGQAVAGGEVSSSLQVGAVEDDAGAVTRATQHRADE